MILLALCVYIRKKIGRYPYILSGHVRVISVCKYIGKNSVGTMLYVHASFVVTHNAVHTVLCCARAVTRATASSHIAHADACDALDGASGGSPVEPPGGSSRTVTVWHTELPLAVLDVI